MTPIIKGLQESSAEVALVAGRLEDDVRLAKLMVKERLGAKVVGMVGASTSIFKDALGKEAGRFVAPSQWEDDASYSPDVRPTAGELGLAGAEYPAAQACAMGLIAQRCVESAGTLEDGELWRAALVLDCTTFYGRFKMDSKGKQVGHSMVVTQWQGGDKRVVWPVEAVENCL